MVFRESRKRLSGIACLAAAVALQFLSVPQAFALRSVQTADDPNPLTNPILAGLESALKEKEERPVSPVEGSLWGRRGQVANPPDGAATPFSRAAAGAEQTRTLKGAEQIFEFFAERHSNSIGARRQEFEKGLAGLNYRQLMKLYAQLDWQAGFVENNRERDRILRDFEVLRQALVKRLRSEELDKMEGIEGVLHRLVRLASQKNTAKQERIQQANSELAVLQPAQLSELLDLYDRHPLNEYGEFKADSDLPVADLIRRAMKPRSWMQRARDNLRFSLKGFTKTTPGQVLGMVSGYLLLPSLLGLILWVPSLVVMTGISDFLDPEFAANLFGGEPREWINSHAGFRETHLAFPSLWLGTVGAYGLSLMIGISHLFSFQKYSEFTLPGYWEQRSDGSWLGIGNPKSEGEKDPQGREKRVILKCDFLGPAVKQAEGTFLPRPDMEYHLAQSYKAWLKRADSPQGDSWKDYAQYPLQGEPLVFEADLNAMDRYDGRQPYIAPNLPMVELPPVSEADFTVQLRRAMERRSVGSSKTAKPTSAGATEESTPLNELIPKDLPINQLTQEQRELLAEEVADYLKTVSGEETGGSEGGTKKLSKEQIEKHQWRVRQIFNWVKSLGAAAANWLRRRAEKAGEPEQPESYAPGEPVPAREASPAFFTPMMEYRLQRLIAQHFFEEPSFEGTGSEIRFEADGNRYVAIAAVKAKFQIGDRQVPIFLAQETRDAQGKLMLGDAGGYRTPAGLFVVLPAVLRQVNQTLLQLRHLTEQGMTSDQQLLAQAYPDRGDETVLERTVLRDVLERVVLHEAGHDLVAAQGLRPASLAVEEQLSYLAPILFGSNPRAQLLFLLDDTPEGDHLEAVIEIEESLESKDPWALAAESPIKETLDPLSRLYQGSAPPKDAADLLTGVRRSMNREEGKLKPVPTKSSPETGLRILLQYVDQQDVKETIALLAESGKFGDVTSDFPALGELARAAGFMEAVEIVRTTGESEAVVGVPVEYQEQGGILVYIKPELRDQIEKNLARLRQAGILRFVTRKEDAFLVIGDSAEPRQVLLKVDAATAAQVTEYLLQGLQVNGRLKAGAVILVYELSKESALIFA